MKKILIIVLFAIITAMNVVYSASISSIQTLCSGKSSEVEITSLPTGSKIYESVQIDCPVLDNDSATVTLDGTVLASYTNSIKFLWQPQKLGNNKLIYTSGDTSLTTTVNVVEFDYFVQPSPKPPMSKDTKISITPTTRNFEASGSGGAIVTSGSGTWTAVASDSWISLSSTSGSAGFPVAYTIGANTNIEERVGYVYVSGYTHTVWQAGIGAEVNKTHKEFEHKGGSDTITVLAQNRILWQARPNCDWISVQPVSGMGENSITYKVAPFNEVTTREGTITVAGNTITIFQYGRRIELDSYSLNVDWYTHVIPIKVNALAISSWSVTPNASWISIVDAGSGKGGDTVTIAVSENPSYKSRKGTVTIGTETFTITQDGRTDLVFTINPEKSTASVEGATGLIAVNATPDLPWSASCNVNWVTILEGFKSGSGTGNIVYTASPNPTLNSRTGKVTVTPDSASGMPSRTHTVTQPAATSSISKSSFEFKASGENCTVDVSVADIVEWTISESLDWITIGGSISRVGPGSVVISASANESVYPRSGTVTIAKKTFKVSQKGRGVEIEYETKLFGTDGGLESISVHPDGNVSWTAVASDPTWITIYQGSTGQGDGEVLYIISPYTGNGESRTGWITIGDKKVYITQRPYDLTIEPNGTVVSGNNGAGEFGVSASIDDVWNAIVTEPWITIVSGYDSGTGNGVVRFVYTENDTGITRTGKIIVSGEIYTIEQAARVLVDIKATAEHGGKVSGAGSYSIGSDVVLTAIPDAGYSFAYWEGDVSSMQNPLTIKVDAEKSVNAVFEPLPIAFDSVVSSVDGVSLSWNNLAWATNYTIYRGITSVPSSAEVLVELENTGNCSYLDTTGEVGETYWYWIEANGAVDSVMSEPMTGKKEKPIIISSITYENLRGATHSNPTTYQEGTLVTFTYPENVVGYTFAGWNPQQISADMTGDQRVSATWTANKYEISYNANGGSGEMTSTSAIYDVDTEIAENGFTFAGHIFKGWSTSVDGSVEYSPNQNVKNLTSTQNGIVVLYAVWEELVVPAPVISPVDGSEFIGETCEVTISCSLPEAIIYYSTNGATPRPTEANRYKGAFNITDTTTIKAFALFDGIKSTYSSAVITKRGLTLAEAVGAKDLVFTTGGDAEWIPVVDETTANGYCAESGAIGLESVTWMETSVTGPGTFSFDWMVDCEEDDSGDCTWDRAIVYTNDVEVARIDGITEWETITFNFTDNAEHIITWEFVKDDYDEEDADYLDAAWVSNVSWTPEVVIEPIPEITDDSEIASALEGSKDNKLLENITSIDEYNAYRAWAKNLSRTSLQDVKDCPFAWLSYALDTDQLIVKEPAQGDLHITAFAPTVAGDSFNMSISLDNINVGTNAKAENLAKLFTIKGNRTLEASNFTCENVNVTYSVPSNGNVNVLVVPKDSSNNSFFIQVVFHLSKSGEEYTITFNANGGEGTMSSQTFTYEVEQALYANTFTREGYTFAGWATSADGTVVYTSGESISVTAPMTLYAVWKANTYAVNFNANGGEGTMSSQIYTYGVEQSLSANAFTREGYTFAGWATSAGGEVAYTARQSICVSTPMTLYAVWQQATEAIGTYIVVDLSGGTSVASYPVTSLSDIPDGGWTDEYKTTKLVLRKITAGKMPRTDVDITLTKDYYVGVFEVTQKQWELVMGSNPSDFHGDTLPVEQVSYDDIRGISNGSQWPASNAVDATSFMGKLRAKTGIDFDLPTEAQWEYACRAGSSGDWGLLADGSMGTLDAMGWYEDNSYCDTHAVGTKTPNAWGLYDMHGNVSEWCLDWYSRSGYSGTDPVGATSGNGRVFRGGGWFNIDGCASSYRNDGSPYSRICDLGLRVAAPAGL